MTDRRRNPLPVADGHYAVPDPDDPDRLTYWSVQQGKVRDHPDDVRWRPLPPPVPAELADRADRRQWTHQWYQDVYFPWRAAVDAAIMADPAAARDRFAATYPHARLPEPSRRRRDRTRAPRPRRSRKLSAAEQRLATERLAVRALHQLGYSYRRIGEELDLPLTTVHRRIHNGTPAEAATVTLLARARELETALLAGRMLEPEHAEQVDKWLADLRVTVDRLTRQRESGHG